MRGVYTVEIKVSALATTKLGLLLINVSTKVLEIISAHIGNVGTNVTNQQLEAQLCRISSVGSPVGTGVTPNPEEPGDQASALVATTNVLGALSTDVTTKGVNVDHQGFASLAGYQFAPVPEERPVIAPSGAMGLGLVVAPGVAFDAVFQIKYREIG
jgi:hypothetical protein